MAGGSQTLTSTIVINAVGNGIDALGSTLQQLGNRISGLSSQLIEFGKESLDVYREYELSMKDAEVALATTYGRGTTQLSNVMKQLDEQATEWAATSVFHTNDVANAISEAAHAGWDFNQIMAGIPAAMELANAGSMDLSDAVNYIVKSTNAAGVEFDDIGSLIDHWAFAAHSSATTIDEMGDAMLRMGSTMKFAGGTDEVLVLLAALANAGTVGSDAGTLLRNSMLRLVAPTKKAKEAMEELGASQEEITEVMENEEVAAANAALATAGFSAYDEQGNLKDMLTIFTELATALDQIGDEETQNAILGSIFPTRSITGAMNLWNAAKNGFDGLYESFQRGDAEGYGEYAMTEKLQTLNGEIAIFESKIERLKQVTGKELSGDLIPVLSSINGFVDSLANMDDASFSGLVGGLEVLGAAGPALLTTGTALRFIAWVMKGAGPVGWMALGAVGLTALANGMHKFNEEVFRSNFGEMGLDRLAISENIKSIADSFSSAYAEANKFRGELEQSVAAYETASTEFSSTLLTDMLTGLTLTDADKQKLTSLGDEMYNTLTDSITASHNESAAYWTAFFGGADEAEGSSAFQEIISILDSGQENAIAEAESISESIRDALNSAFEDGKISDDEYANILSYVQSYNEALARAEREAQERQDYIDRSMQLHKAQTAGYDEVKAMSDEAAASRDQSIAEEEARYQKQLYGAQWDAEQAGTPISPETLAEIESVHAERISAIRSESVGQIMNLWSALMSQGETSGDLAILQELANGVLAGGSLGDATSAYKASGAKGSAMQRTLSEAIMALGGYDALISEAQYLGANGQQGIADRLMQLYTMQQIASGGIETEAMEKPFGIIGNGVWSDLMLPEYMRMPGSMQSSYSQRMADYYMGGNSPIAQASAMMQGLTQNDAGWAQAVTNAASLLSQTYDIAAVYRDLGNAGTLNPSSVTYPLQANQVVSAMTAGTVNAEDYRINVTPVVDQSALSDLPPVDVPANLVAEGGGPAADLGEQGVDVNVNADTSELQAGIQAEDGQQLTANVDGETSSLHSGIMAENGLSLWENVYANTASASAAINALNGRVITVYMNTVRTGAGFAEGGRATEASIFGEAGPEWAIPEEHTERTAELLNAAREASGFTWPDLIARFGGLGASADNTPSTLVYSPTINAVDAAGVDQVLLNDKTRLDRWYEERKMRDRAEVYYA